MVKAHIPLETLEQADAACQKTQLAPLLDKLALCERLNISPRTIENMVKSGTFPPPVRVGRFVYWSENAVSSWQRRMFAAQEAWDPRTASQCWASTAV